MCRCSLVLVALVHEIERRESKKTTFQSCYSNFSSNHQSLLIMLLLLFELFLAVVLSNIIHTVLIILYVKAQPFDLELDAEEIDGAVNAIAFNTF